MKSKKQDNWQPLKCETLSNNESVACHDMTHIISDELTKVINNIAVNIPNFYVGRFDIGFDSWNDLQKGENFKIFELNGVMGFDLRALFNTYNPFLLAKNILLWIRWIIVRLIIGFINLVTLNSSICNMIQNMPNKLDKALQCHNYEIIFQPSSA